MNKIIIIIVYFLLFFKVEAQLTFEWDLHMGGPNIDEPAGIIAIKNNLFSIGNFSDTIRCVENEAYSKGGNDIFLMKIDLDGIPEWINSLGGEKSDNATCFSANNHQIYIGATIYGDVFSGDQIFEGEGTRVIISAWGHDGMLKWLHSFSYSGYAQINFVQIFPNGLIMAGGVFQGTIKINNIELESRNIHEAWMATLTPKGSLVDASKCSTRSGNNLLESCLDEDGNLYLLFGNTQGAFLTLQKREGMGKILWEKEIKGTGYLKKSGLDINKKGEPLVCLNFNEKLHVGDTIINCKSQLKTVIINFDKLGNTNWINTISSRVNSHALDFLVDNFDNIYLTGAFREEFSIDNISVESGTSNSCFFLIHFDKDGKLIWYDAPISGGANLGRMMTDDKNGNIFIAGSFRDNISLYDKTISNEGNYLKNDIFF